jgi:undecaprenyl-diphosphatase
VGLVESLDRLDRSVFLATAGQGDLWVDHVFIAVSNIWVAFSVWLVLWAVQRPKRTFTAWMWLLITMVAAFAAADWAATLLKNIFERPRPCFALEGEFRLVASCRGAFGFVSGHAATTWALLTVYMASRPHRAFAIFAIVWALAVPFSRVYLGVHYPGDVLGGAVLGMIIGRLLVRIRPLSSGL